MVNRKELHPERSPRDKFGQLVRAMRDERGWTQDDLAQQLGCTGSQVSAIETGRRPATQRFAKKLDLAFGTGDRLERQSQAARPDALLEGFPEYVGYEGRAVEIRQFQIGIIPGLLQTPAYAKAIAESDIRRGSITPEQADERLLFLAQRQAVFARPRPPMVLAVLDESCILRRIGGPAVMNAQFERLVEFASLPNTVLQIAPFSIGERRPFDLPVNLLTLADRSLVAYAETHAQGQVDRDSAGTLPLLASYHHLQAESLSQTASVAMIEQHRKGSP
jgi:transcriptional regulator with XRE-family HTH domain